MPAPMISTNRPGEWVSLEGLTSLAVERSDREDGGYVLFAFFDRRRQIIHRGPEAECIELAGEVAKRAGGEA